MKGIFGSTIVSLFLTSPCSAFWNNVHTYEIIFAEGQHLKPIITRSWGTNYIEYNFRSKIDGYICMDIEFHCNDTDLYNNNIRTINEHSCANKMDYNYGIGNIYNSNIRLTGIKSIKELT